MSVQIVITSYSIHYTKLYDKSMIGMDPLTVLIVDDHPLFRKGMRALLDALPDFQYVGEAASGRGAVEMASRNNFV